MKWFRFAFRKLGKDNAYGEAILTCQLEYDCEKPLFRNFCLCLLEGTREAHEFTSAP